ncbi:Uncharacterised protein [Mycobacteroides abscessus subsp. abscessus]|nr:Uncharacterised protein [Mycobacteroides abscessus subsp. abscessus]SKZ25738.1 Uncharacterised protein [Mycobacteroides abscessus subsp. abscessus]
MLMRSARHAAASASDCLCQSATDWPVTMRTASTSVVLPIVTVRRVGVRVRPPSVAVRPCKVQVDSQVRV